MARKAALVLGSCCALALVAGCGMSTVSGSCALADHTRCTDYSQRAPDLASVQSMCTGEGDTWSAGSCVTTGSVGGCTKVEGIETQTDWFFGNARTATEIQSACVASGGTFIAR